MRIVKVNVKGGEIYAVTDDGELKVTDIEDLGAKKEKQSTGFMLVDEESAVYLAIPFEQVAQLKEAALSLVAVTEKLSLAVSSQGSSPAAVDPTITESITKLKLDLEKIELL